ncbi:MAG: hypothetical protein ACI32P_03220 [Catenibacterium mitsuokai]
MCSEKQESEPGFPGIKPDDCPMLIMLSQMTASAFLELDFDGDEEVEMNRQQCYEMLKVFFTHFGCESILRELAILESCGCFEEIHESFMHQFLYSEAFIPFILKFK